ncbi:MAG TPA: chemotaxis response regulator protein-glutamate methylesterase [Moraxellaceae bacterium]
MKVIRVFLVDDTAVVRRVLSQILEEESDIEVAGMASNGAEALQRIGRVEPDIIVLDIEMPDMNGLDMLRALRASGSSVPVLVFSSLTERGAMVTIEALLLGANDYVLKPSMLGSVNAVREHIRSTLIPRLRQLLGRRAPIVAPPAVAAALRPEPVVKSSFRLPDLAAGQVDVVVIGVSTGGPNALSDLLPQFPADFPVPILIVQHMPAFFTKALAQRLDRICALEVVEGLAHLRPKPGQVILAPGGRHLLLMRDGDAVWARPDDAEPENFCRPAADVLFRSAAKVYGPRTLGVVLTGMGQDGESGSRQIREQGGQVIVQDQASSVVWGMPAAVMQAGLANAVLPLAEMPAEIMKRAAVCRPWFSPPASSPATTQDAES